MSMKKTLNLLSMTIILIIVHLAVAEQASSATLDCPPEANLCLYPARDSFLDALGYYENGDDGDLVVGYDTNADFRDSIAFLKFELPGDLPPADGIDTVKLELYVAYIQAFSGAQLFVTGIMDDDYWPASSDRSDDNLTAGLTLDHSSESIESGIVEEEWIMVDVTDYVVAEMEASTDHQYVTFMLEGRSIEEINYFIFADLADENGQLHDDAADNGSRLVFTYDIDTNPPTGELIINGGAAVANNRDVELTISASDAEGSTPIQMRFSHDGVDWGNWENVASPANWTLLEGDGTKTVYMELRDAAGNVTNPPLTATIELDQTPPTITGIADGEIRNTAVVVTFDEGMATLNGNPFSSGDTIGEGNYTLVVTDDAGNTTTVSFKIDQTAPTGTLAINGGAAATNDRDVQLTVSASDAAGTTPITMRLSNNGIDWGNWEVVTSPVDWTLPEGDGTKTVYMELRDAAGNVSEPLLASINLDTKAPTGTLTINGGAVATNDTQVELTVSATDASGLTPIQMRFRNDGDDWEDDWQYWVDETTPIFWTLPGGDGPKIVYMELRDALGNVMESPLTASIELDTKAPVITGIADGDIVNVDVFVTFDGTGELNGSAITSGSTVSAEGEYELVVSDEAGNVTSVSFVIDKTPPTISYFAIAGGIPSVDSSTVSLAVYAEEPLSGLEMRFKNEDSHWENAWVPAQQVRENWELSEGEGTKTVSVQLRDQAGNESAVVEDSIVVDLTEPTATVEINDGALYTNNTTVTLAVYAQELLVNLEMRFSNQDGIWDDADWEPAQPTKQWELDPVQGVQVVYMQLRDAAGHTATASDSIILDTEKPTGSIQIANGAASITSSNVTLHLTYHDASPLQMRFSNDDSGDWSAWEDAATEVEWTLSSGKGNKTVHMQLRDAAGNVSDPINDAIQVRDKKRPNDGSPVSDDSGNEDAPESDRDEGQDEGERQPDEQDGVTFASPAQAVIDQIESEAERLGIELIISPIDVAFVVDEEDAVYKHVTINLEQPGEVYAAVWQADGTLLPLPVVTNQDHIRVSMMDSGIVVLFRNETVFADTVGHWAEPQIRELADRLIISGTGDGNYVPHRPVTRAEAATAWMRTLGLWTTEWEQRFEDVPVDSWSSPYVDAAHSFGLIRGYADQTFRPNQPINRQEMAMILFQAMHLAGMDTDIDDQEIDHWLRDYPDQESISAWAREAVALSIRNGLMSGDENRHLLPQEQLTRAQMAVILARFKEAFRHQLNAGD